jgi:hypothetical protein
LPGLRLDGILLGSDIGFGVVYARLDLRGRFVLGLVGGALHAGYWND